MPSTGGASRARNGILWLGTAGGLFGKRYVALMPALRWLPVPGPNLDGASRGHFPTVDLTVTVPDGWLVAGPGRHHPQDDGSYRFGPEAPVPKVGLFASRFKRHVMEVAGVELELLLHPDPSAQSGSLRERGRSHRVSRLQRIIGEAAAMGIPYPYDGFSVVEVPTYLRVYGGGSRLDTAMSLPGMLLLREHGFPLFRHGKTRLPPNGGNPGCRRQIQGPAAREPLFNSVIDPGNASRALARNLLGFQVVADGPGARALDYVNEELASEVFKTTDSRAITPTIYTAHQLQCRCELRFDSYANGSRLAGAGFRASTGGDSSWSSISRRRCGNGPPQPRWWSSTS